MVVLNLFSVGHAYLSGEWLFQGLVFELIQGEHVAIQGTSGCGKSTLLNIMAGLEVPSEGEVYWSNQPTSAWSAEHRRSCRQSEMGFVFQAFHLLPHLSALQNVMVPCLLGGQSGQTSAAAARSLLCALARALVHKPKVVFADEPTGNLDTTTAANTLALLIDLCKASQTSLVVVTHSDEAARSIGKTFRLTPQGLVC
jgi:ABC-type lipoprotein export system ATPase subunit